MLTGPALLMVRGNCETIVNEMFTGIVETTASVQRLDSRAIEISTGLAVAVGDSIAVDGVCLTVADVTEHGFRIELSEETWKRTTLGRLEDGEKVNLERAMPASGRFGGHFVQGHVDGMAYMLERDRLPNSVEMLFEFPPALNRYIVEKGSVAIHGVSLTVARTEGDRFMVSVIPHTLEATNLAAKKPGDPVNIEVDLIAKYIEKLASFGIPSGSSGAEATEDFPPAPEIGSGRGRPISNESSAR